MALSFHGFDANLIINSFRLVLEGWKLLRTQSGQKEPEKKEEVLEEAVKKAEQMSEAGADGENVASEIGSALERELGSTVKDDVLSRAASILAIAQPFETKAFRYYDNLDSTLSAVRQFCVNSNVFVLRARTVKGVQYLPMPKLGLALNTLFKDTEVFRAFIPDRHVIRYGIAHIQASLTSAAGNLSIIVILRILRATSMGESYSDEQTIELFLRPGTQVNRIGFRSLGRTTDQRIVDFELLVLGTEFEALIKALLDDVTDYTGDLANEQRAFKERFAPMLLSIAQALARANPG